MEEKTLKALLDSIDHWKNIVSVIKKNMGKPFFRKGVQLYSADNSFLFELGPEACSLCNIFVSGNCVGCPVYEFTGKGSCMNTPYDRISLELRTSKLFHGNILVVAEDEVQFLTERLPKGFTKEDWESMINPIKQEL